MSILYLLTAPPPPIPGTDAVFNEVAALQAEFGGETMNLFPSMLPGRRYPSALFGLHAIPQLRRAETGHQITHVYFPVLRWLPVLGLLKNPIVYTVSASLDPAKPPARLERLKRLARIVVSNDRDADTLRSWGFSNFDIIPTSIDAAAVSRTPTALGRDLIVLMASAPWHPRHFDTKGVDLLLEATARTPDLRLILLWRGMLQAELAERITRFGLQRRVEVINEKAPIDRYLARSHATVLLAKERFVVKAYPHSLLESLFGGKPVLLSDKIPMADFVRRHGCGIVVDELTVPAVVKALVQLRRSYDTLAQNTEALPLENFSWQSMAAAHRAMYARITGAGN